MNEDSSTIKSVRERRFAAYAWVTLAGNMLVVLWGAYVRATGSGAGCGGHWPLCNGVVLPRQPAVETIIEFTHRLSSGLALILVVILFLFARRIYEKGTRVRSLTTVAVILMIVEALLGAGLVLFELVAGNTSLIRAAAGAAHLLNTFLLLATLGLAASWSSWTAYRSDDAPAPIYKISVGIGLLGVLFIGMTGAIAALGDTLFPSTSLLAGLQQDLNPGSHILLRLRALHPIIALGVSLYLLGLIRIVQAKFQIAGALPGALIGLIVLQLAAGSLNVILLAPVWLQIIHLLLADSLWIGLVLVSDRFIWGRPARPSAIVGLQG